MYKFCLANSFKVYSFVVIVTMDEDGKYLLSRKKNFDTWEFQGGHIENGESPYDAAVRELKEEAGILDAKISALIDYQTDEKDTHGNTVGKVRYGVIFLAKIPQNNKFEQLMCEMEEVRFFDELPNNMTYFQMAKKIEKIIRGDEQLIRDK